MGHFLRWGLPGGQAQGPEEEQEVAAGLQQEHASDPSFQKARRLLQVPRADHEIPVILGSGQCTVTLYRVSLSAKGASMDTSFGSLQFRHCRPTCLGRVARWE